jgi:hypothetical protein
MLREDSPCRRFGTLRSGSCQSSGVAFAAIAEPEAGALRLESRFVTWRKRLYTRGDGSWHASRTARQLELRFHALLTEGDAERLELVRA